MMQSPYCRSCQEIGRFSDRYLILCCLRYSLLLQVGLRIFGPDFSIFFPYFNIYSKRFSLLVNCIFIAMFNGLHESSRFVRKCFQKWKSVWFPQGLCVWCHQGAFVISCSFLIYKNGNGLAEKEDTQLDSRGFGLVWFTGYQILMGH